MGTRLKVLVHACKRGNMWASITSNQWATPPKAMSAIPILSCLRQKTSCPQGHALQGLSAFPSFPSWPSLVLHLQWFETISRCKDPTIYVQEEHGWTVHQLQKKKKMSKYICTLSSANWTQNQQWILRPHLFNVLKDNRWLTDRFSSMNKHWDHLVNRVALQKHGTFVGKIFFYVLIWYVLQFQSPYDPVTKWTRPCSY